MQPMMPYLTRETTKAGSFFYRVRKGSTRAVVPGEPFSEEFMQNYADLISGARPRFSRAECAERVVFQLNAPPRKVSYMLSKARGRAAVKGLPFGLSEQWIIDTFNAQRGDCALSGIPMTFESLNGRRPHSASIDRIDSDLGYTEINCRLVCVIVNLSLLNWGDATFISMCKAVAKKHK